MKIGIFDSGMGGKALAASLAATFPKAAITVVDDHANVPYGSKTTEEIIRLTLAAVQPLIQAEPDAIIIACNTATMAAIETLRRTYPKQPFIGLEPMIKPAAKQTKTGIIAVCATPSTLASARFTWLTQTYAQGVEIVTPDCLEWAHKIETGAITREFVAATLAPSLEKNIDVVVLGCTHYHWIKDMVQSVVGEAVTVLEPSEAIARRVLAVTTMTEEGSVTSPQLVPGSALTYL